MTAGAVAVPTIVPLRPPLSAKSKTSVDSNTKIELRSETPDTDIYYTINGSKPEPFQKIGEKCTLKYRGPFTLPAGKRPVKAVALTKDGVRESNVVTKVFDVEYVPVEPLLPEDDGLSFQHQMEKERRELELKRATKNYLLSSTKSAWTDVQRTRDTEQLISDLDTRRSELRNTGTNRFSTSRLGSNTERSLGLDTERSAVDYRRERRSMPDNSTQSLRLHRQTDFFKCVYCFADRPSDPYARFCHDCGNPVPPVSQSRASPPEPGQMGMCSFCHSMVPFNTRSCVVCEAPIPGQSPPSPNRLGEKKVCTLCGTANPSTLTSCLTCDARLPTGAILKGVYSGMSAPPLPKSEGKLLQCNKCGRVNNGDSRFCDWCGAKPDQPSVSLVCSKCRASNHPYANFCGSCGVKIEAPMRNGYVSASIDGQGALQAKWKPVTLPLGGTIASRATSNVATQTVGLFFPSQTEILKHQQREQEREALVKKMSDKQPVLTAVSPGRGYWRKQMDHICQHLKTYAANNAEFRALIGEPKMGKLLSTSIDEDSYQLSIMANFALRGARDHLPESKNRLSKGDYLNKYDINEDDDSYSDRGTVSEPTTPISSARSRKGVKKAKKPKKKDVEKLNPEDRKLLKEVGIGGEGRAAEIQHLIDEGADPCLVNKDDLPLLHVAVKNKHAEAIPVIVQAGAEVNKKGPTSIKGNTALHEAVMLGSSALEVIEALLDNGADIQKKNDKGESSYDLAAKANYESIVTKFASTLGQSQLMRMTKPKY